MSDAANTPPRPASPWWRLVWVCLGLVALIAAVSFGLALYARWQAEGRLRAEVEALDEADPDWRLDDLMRTIPELPAEENSAPRLLVVIRSVPKGWPKPEELELMYAGLQPNHHFGKRRMGLLNKVLAPVKAQRLAGRELVKYPRGQHKLALAENPLLTVLDDQQKTREFAVLLDLDALGLAQEGDIKGALASARACINAGNALEHEPFLISVLIRIAVHQVAMKSVERSLALGEAPAPDLEQVQNALWPWTRSPGLVLALRGERAAMDRAARLLAEGTFDGKLLEALLRDGPSQRVDWAEGAWNWLTSPNWQSAAQQGRPELLRILTRAVENAKLPPEKQAAAEDELEQEVKTNAGPLVRLLLPATQKTAEAGRRGMAYALSMHTLVGCERHRLKHGKWPDKLEALVPEFIPEVPKDPFDGKPLRYKAWADGVVVYSVGANGKDDGGDVASGGLKDFGFRLWDRDKRRQPAPPLKPAGGPP